MAPWAGPTRDGRATFHPAGRAGNVTWSLERLPSCTSTMDVARERARSGAADGTVVVADEMTAGRGTHGRTWHAPVGGLYLSFVVRDLADPHLLTLALGTAVADALEVAGVDARLKWVNDVVVPDASGQGFGKKIAGILVEGEFTGDRMDFLVAGIGINVNGPAQALPADIRASATTLEDELHCDTCIPDLEALLLDRIAHWLDRVRAGADAQIIAAFTARDALRGQRVRVEDGAAGFTGTAEGLDPQGRLLVRSAAGVQAVATGRVLPA